MGLFAPRQSRAFYGIEGAQDLIPTRTTGGARAVGNQVVTNDRALKSSVYWACLKLRASLISTFPIDQYRDVLGIQTEWPYKPAILTDPGGMRVDIVDWMAMTQRDLDAAGNTVGLIVERSTARSPYYPQGLPSRIELQPISACSYIERRDRPDQWRIGSKIYDLGDVYHEMSNPQAGMKVGLPTTLYAALSIGEGLSMQQHGLDWFSGGGIPKAHMRNTMKLLEGGETDQVKQWWRDVVANGDMLVTGKDWEYEMIQAQNAGMEFIAGRDHSNLDVCRFMDTPGDLVDVNQSGASITYANITQRNLQYLIYRLGPATINREKALSKLLPRPRYVKLNTEALLRMDPMARQELLKSKIETWQLTNSETRALDNLPPLDTAQLAEMATIYGRPAAGGRLGTQQSGSSGESGQESSTEAASAAA